MNEHLLLGAPVLDKQHHGLFVSFRKLAATGEDAFPKEAMSDVLSELTTAQRSPRTPLPLSSHALETRKT